MAVQYGSESEGREWRYDYDYVNENRDRWYTTTQLFLQYVTNVYRCHNGLRTQHKWKANIIN